MKKLITILMMIFAVIMVSCANKVTGTNENGGGNGGGGNPEPDPDPNPEWNVLGNEDFVAAYDICNVIIAFDKNNTPYLSYATKFHPFDDTVIPKIDVMKYNGNSWQSTGINLLFPGSDRGISSFAISSSGISYIAYETSHKITAGDDITLEKQDGRTWEIINNRVEVPTEAIPGYGQAAQSPRIAINSRNVPYLLFDVSWKKPVVMKYESGSWEVVGDPNGFSKIKDVSGVRLAIDSKDVPYTMYENYGDRTYAATVMKFNGGSWQVVGAENFNSTNPPKYGDGTSLFIDNDDVPYILYSTKTQKIVVMKFDGSSWVNVGDTLGTGYVNSSQNCIVFDNNNVPHIAYLDYSSEGGERTTVLKFNGSSWEVVGKRGFSRESRYFHAIPNLNLAFDNNNILHITYSYAVSDSHLAAVNVSVMKFD